MESIAQKINEDNDLSISQACEDKNVDYWSFRDWRKKQILRTGADPIPNRKPLGSRKGLKRQTKKVLTSDHSQQKNTLPAVPFKIEAKPLPQEKSKNNVVVLIGNPSDIRSVLGNLL